MPYSKEQIVLRKIVYYQMWMLFCTIFTSMELLSLYQYTVVVGGAHLIVSGVCCNSIDGMLW